MCWQADKGFGFIQPRDGGENIFCHAKSLGSVVEGDSLIGLFVISEYSGKTSGRFLLRSFKVMFTQCSVKLYVFFRGNILKKSNEKRFKNA